MFPVGAFFLDGVFSLQRIQDEGGAIRGHEIRDAQDIEVWGNSAVFLPLVEGRLRSKHGIPPPGVVNTWYFYLNKAIVVNGLSDKRFHCFFLILCKKVSDFPMDSS